MTLLSLSGLLVGAVDDEESDDRYGAFSVGEVGRGIVSVEGIIEGMAFVIVGERGAIACLSLTEQIIFSKPSDVMCFSRPREAAIVVGVDCAGDNLMSNGDMGDDSESSEASESSDASESTLAERSGTSLRPGGVLAMSIAGVVVSEGWVSQQRVSRFHIRQLRFSSLRPFSIDSAHLEKTVNKD